MEAEAEAISRRASAAVLESRRRVQVCDVCAAVQGFIYSYFPLLASIFIAKAAAAAERERGNYIPTWTGNAGVPPPPPASRVEAAGGGRFGASSGLRRFGMSTSAGVVGRFDDGVSPMLPSFGAGAGASALPVKVQSGEVAPTGNLALSSQSLLRW